MDVRNQFDWTACEEEQGNVDMKTMINLWFMCVVLKGRKMQENANGEEGTGIDFCFQELK